MNPICQDFPLVTSAFQETAPLENRAWLLRGSPDAPGVVGMPGVRRYVAWALTSPFLTSPFFGNAPGTVPAGCQCLLWEEGSGGFGVVVPLLDGDYRTEVTGDPQGLSFVSECGPVGKKEKTIALAVVYRADDPYQALSGAMAVAVRWMGRGRLREEKKTPSWIDYLGWCTWDAFYTDVDEAKVFEGLEAFRDGGVVPGHFILDEGWQDADRDKYLQSLGLKEGAFTGGQLRILIDRAKSEFGVRKVGCWRTLFGQLRGVDVEAEGLAQFRRRLVHELGTEKDTFGVVEPEDVERFHEQYAERLAEQGVDFMKVDFQSALHLMTYEQLGRAAGARLWQHSLQDSVEEHFQGEMLNCMALGSDEVFHTKTSNVARSSDDFFPARDESHPAHIRQNAYNALWLSHLQWTDWDMFHSLHPWGFFHAIGRAVSGGPVYVSDRPKESDYDLLRRFLASDGKTLRCPQPALPVRGQIFEDPVAAGKMIRVFNRCGDIGLLALFHPSTTPSADALTEQVEACEIEGQADKPSAVYSVTRGFLGVVKPDETLPLTLGVREAELFIFSPVLEGSAPLGLIDKLNPPAAILSRRIQGDRLLIESRGGGRFGFFSERQILEVTVNDVSVDVDVLENGLFTIDTGEDFLTRISIQTGPPVA